MKFFQTFNVVPSLPEELKPLRELAYNYWWGWNADAFNVFRHIDSERWTESRHNPIKFLSQVSQERLNELARDEGFMYHLNRVTGSFQSYMNRKTWFQGRKSDSHFRVAYFSAEFGISEGLPIYAGGLGVLAGDHLKSASDLGVPLVGMGLAYRQGYFRQYLTQDGWQQERSVENDFYNMPMIQERTPDGKPLMVDLDFPGRKVLVHVWRVQVGRIPLYLLDTNVAGNSPADRNITGQLYGGDQEMRLQQEIVLGIGGIRALDKLGWLPAVTHMNEGHSAFLALERIFQIMEKGNLTYEEAREVVAGSNIFTTHTPVPAGIDMFGPELIEKYFSSYYKKFGITLENFLELGRVNPANRNEPFSMAILALHLSTRANGVAKLHGKVSRRMWRDLWPNLPLEEIPIGHVTNGVHVNSWISMEMSELFDRYLGPRWVEEPGDQRIWERISEIPSAELWRTHERRRERLVGYVRRRLRQQLQERGLPREEVELADQVLDPEALTIGFARRFATYKRANLIFRDIDRLVRMITNKNMPLQIIFAGKAHPNDEPGKRLIQEVVRIARRPELRRHLVFLEDYDLNTAHYLLQGIDVWLNNPRRPLEASGTSGMKAVFNGGLNCSILDGWWDEGYNGENGWAIGRGEEYSDNEYQDRVESAALNQILENELIPLFYDRGPDGVPEKWIQRMKCSMTSLGPVFNTNRMVTEYTEKLYIPQVERLHKFVQNNYEAARNLAAWKNRVAAAWSSIQIEKIESENVKELPVGANLPVRATISLGNLKPEDLQVEIYSGLVDGNQNMHDTTTVVMHPEKTIANNRIVYRGDIPCTITGHHGYTVRVMPNHPDMAHRFETNLILWA